MRKALYGAGLFGMIALGLRLMPAYLASDGLALPAKWPACRSGAIMNPIILLSTLSLAVTLYLLCLLHRRLHIVRWQRDAYRACVEIKDRQTYELQQEIHRLRRRGLAVSTIIDDEDHTIRVPVANVAGCDQSVYLN